MNRWIEQRWFHQFGPPKLVSVWRCVFSIAAPDGPAAPEPAPIPPHSGAAPFHRARLTKLLALNGQNRFRHRLPKSLPAGLLPLVHAERGRLHGVSRPGDARAIADRLGCHVTDWDEQTCRARAAQLAEPLRDWPLLLLDQALRAGVEPSADAIRSLTQPAFDVLWARLDRLDAMLDLPRDPSRVRDD